MGNGTSRDSPPMRGGDVFSGGFWKASEQRTGTTTRASRGQVPSTTSSTGAPLLANPMERTVKYYPVLESELDNLGLQSVETTLCFSLSFAFFSAWLTLFLESKISPEASAAGKVLLTAGPWVLAVLAFATLFVGCWSWVVRKRHIQRIRDQSKQTGVYISTSGTDTR